jgi:hypothetical protein
MQARSRDVRGGELVDDCGGPAYFGLAAEALACQSASGGSGVQRSYFVVKAAVDESSEIVA